MTIVKRKLSKTFRNFFESKKSGGVLLIICTAISLLITNSAAGEGYLGLWHTYVGGLSLEHWVNDALMAVFFLLIGLELERELYVGELSDFRNALLPIVAALGGIAAPALIHFALNAGTPGLLLGKPVGITLLSFIAVATGVCRLPLDLNWRHVFGAGILGGIGFTMSIFITNLAFVGEAEVVNASKMAILLASLTAGAAGFLWLKLLGQPVAGDEDMDTMDFAADEASATAP